MEATVSATTPLSTIVCVADREYCGRGIIDDSRKQIGIVGTNTVSVISFLQFPENTDLEKSARSQVHINVGADIQICLRESSIIPLPQYSLSATQTVRMAGRISNI